MNTDLPPCDHYVFTHPVILLSATYFCLLPPVAARFSNPPHHLSYSIPAANPRPSDSYLPTSCSHLSPLSYPLTSVIPSKVKRLMLPSLDFASFMYCLRWIDPLPFPSSISYRSLFFQFHSTYLPRRPHSLCNSLLLPCEGRMGYTLIDIHQTESTDRTKNCGLRIMTAFPNYIWTAYFISRPAPDNHNLCR